MDVAHRNPQRLGVLLTLFLLANLTSNGQSAFTISGKVTEISRGSLRARVRLFSADRVLETTARDDGSFGFAGLSPGVYDVEAGEEGFQIATIEGVRIANRDVAGLSFTLRPGDGNGRCVIAISGGAAKAEGLPTRSASMKRT